jgi:hypothetical protein
MENEDLPGNRGVFLVLEASCCRQTTGEAGRYVTHRVIPGDTAVSPGR